MLLQDFFSMYFISYAVLPSPPASLNSAVIFIRSRKRSCPEILTRIRAPVRLYRRGEVDELRVSAPFGTSQAFSSIELPGVLPRRREIDT